MKKHQRDMRLKSYDYQTNGAYFVTICTDFKKKFISRKEKIILEKELRNLENRFAGVTIDYFAIMNNHLHIIFLFDEANINLPRVIQAFKSLTTLKLKQNGFTGKVFWQRNYYEHVIRSEKTLEKIREYIQ
ncbi:MAG TPA: transposase, partial [Candidatus Subteraquimicrobiales bacterium]